MELVIIWYGMKNAEFDFQIITAHNTFQDNWVEKLYETVIETNTHYITSENSNLYISSIKAMNT